ncbi:MAG: hypothetical protein Q4C34_06550 [Bacteroidales bacterium]|nr:hypothetical protein [Bacteroidales bacterium]
MTRTTVKTPRRRGRSRRKLRKGRVALALTVLALLIVSIVTLVSWLMSGTVGCTRGGGDFRRPVTEAIECGRRDAEKVMSTAPESMERQRALLDIRAREAELRENGHAHAADDYINSATDYLKTHKIL